MLKMKKAYALDVYKRYNKIRHGISFCWGQIKKIHSISNFEIIEYYNHEEDSTQYHVYVRNNENILKNTNSSYETLDKAIIGALTYKYDSFSCNTDTMIFRMLQI